MCRKCTLLGFGDDVRTFPQRHELASYIEHIKATLHENPEDAIVIRENVSLLRSYFEDKDDHRLAT